MKFLFILILFVNICYIKLGLLKNSALRVRMQSLACNLFRKYDDLKKLDVNFIKIAKDNSKHNDLDIDSKEYTEFLNKVKSFGELGNQYLVYKMLYGDKIASKVFNDIRKYQRGPPSQEELNENDVMNRIKKVVELTNGFGAENYATFQALEYLQNTSFNLKRGGCNTNILNKQEISFLERRFKRTKYRTKDPIYGWSSIKFYKFVKNARINDVPYWKKQNENFPMVIEYSKQPQSRSCIFNDQETVLVDNLDSVQKRTNCDIQIISGSTEDTREEEIVPVNVSKNSLNVKFYVSENRLDYNCIGWSIGLQDFLNTVLYTQKSKDVLTKQHLILYLLQFSEALKFVDQNKNNKNVYNRILNKKKPPPSLINNLVSSDNPKLYLEQHLIGLNDGINQQEIEKLCSGDFDGAVIFYGQKNKMSHGARFVKSLNLWTSKLGQSYLITHNLEQMSDSPTEKSLYGFPKFLYCPNGLSNANVPGANPNRTDFS
jgi:hypothetical protein